jgi:hypothetical protein
LSVEGNAPSFPGSVGDHARLGRHGSAALLRGWRCRSTALPHSALRLRHRLGCNRGIDGRSTAFGPKFFRTNSVSCALYLLKRTRRAVVKN